MNEDEKDPGVPQPEGEPRTIFVPSRGQFPLPAPRDEVTQPPMQPHPEQLSFPESQPLPSQPAESQPTQTPPTQTPPAQAAPHEPVEHPVVAPEQPNALTATSYPPGGSSFAPRADGKGIQVGDILNHIFEVKRFIARGGMGEVFEGSNITSDERVAIKVMLPALAADPNVISMFRKEARTLTKLQHEALVQYRVLAQEPQLGVLYIVTEFIDGTNLSDVLGSIHATPEQMVALLRRLASGLATAHALGAIHRDISPDNVLLEGGKLTRAKIIDFGIAKDLDPGSATIVGDGFAGKLNYVAPEQLGDFGRRIGPWTDVYSLGLVMMAVALGRNVRMGGSLVDAVDKRRAGPDVSEMPETIRPVLEQMLRANPVDRLASMDAVIAELDRLAAVPDKGEESKEESGSHRIMVIIGATLALVLAAALIGWFFLVRPQPDPIGGTGGSPASIANGTRDPTEIARSIIDATLPSVSCTWLQIVEVTKSDNGPLVKLTGVAGDPSAAQSEISQALAQRKIVGANLDFEDVSPITQSGCAALDTYRQIRAPASNRLSTPQRKFEMRMQPNDTSLSGYAGQNAANAVVEINVGNPKLDFALIGIEPSGLIDPQFYGDGRVVGRPKLKSLAAAKARSVIDQGADRYKLQLDVDKLGWQGVLLLTGKGPFPEDLIAPPLGARGPNWTQRFVSRAADHGWQTDMVWFKTVDEVKE